LRKEYQDLVAETAEMENKFEEYVLHHTETQVTINTLQIQLQEKQTILGKIVATASDTKIALEAATASVREKRPLADQAERAEKCLTCLLASHRMNGTTFTNTMKEWFKYQTWVHPCNKDNRLIGPQTEAILYVFFDILCFFSKVELENFLGVIPPNHNVGGALLKILEAGMIIKTKNRIGTEQFYLGHFGMEALQRSTIPDIDNRPNNFLESITLRTENGHQLINKRAEKLIATKKKRFAGSQW
jgi:hypothetical protein